MIELIRLMNQRPIAFNKHYVDLGTGINGAVMLSQLVYWADKSNNPHGWIYKTSAEWTEETGLTRREQDTARKTLRELGFVDEDKRGVPCKIHFKVNQEKLYSALLDLAQKRQTDAQKRQTECTNPPNKDGGKRQTITESTAENTTQSTQDILNNNIHEVFEYWKSVFKKNAATKLAGVRESKLKARLKEGYSVDDIKKAILNCSQSDYHVQNGYTDLELICRDQVKLDRFISLQKPSVQPVPDYTQNRMADLEREAQLWEQQNARFGN